jgi:hypothetical protein
MKTLLLAIMSFALAYAVKAQQKISGIVTHGLDQSDTGATAFLYDSSLAGRNVISLLEAKCNSESDQYAIADRLFQMRSEASGMGTGEFQFVLMGKEIDARRVSSELRVLHSSIDRLEEARSRQYSRVQLDSAELLIYGPGSPLFAPETARMARTNGQGSYSFSITGPGTYYVLVKSSNERASVNTGTSFQHKYYLKKLRIYDGEDRNDMITFRL